MPGLQRSPGSPRPGSSGEKSRGTFHAKTKINNFHGGVYIADVEDEEVQQEFDNRVRMDAENAAMVEAKRKLKILEKKAQLNSDNDHLQKVEEFNQKRSEDHQQMRAQTKDMKEFDKQIGESKKRTADLDRKHEKQFDGAIIQMDQKYFANLDTQKLREKLVAQEQHQQYLEHQVANKFLSSKTLAQQDSLQSSPLQNSLPIEPHQPGQSNYKTILDTQLAQKNSIDQKTQAFNSKTTHTGYQEYKKVFDKKYGTTQGTGPNTRKNTDNTFTSKTVTICNTDLEEAQRIMLDRVKSESLKKAQEREADRVLQMGQNEAHGRFVKAEWELKERKRLELERGLRRQMDEKRRREGEGLRAEARGEPEGVGRGLGVDVGKGGKTLKARDLESPSKLR